MFTRGDPESIINGDGGEQLGMPEDMEATYRTPARVLDMLDDLVEKYVRDAFSASYSSSHVHEEEDEDIDVYEPEHEV